MTIGRLPFSAPSARCSLCCWVLGRLAVAPGRRVRLLAARSGPAGTSGASLPARSARSAADGGGVVRFVRAQLRAASLLLCVALAGWRSPSRRVVCSVLAVALQVRAAPLCPLAVCQAPETAAASSGPFVPICVLWWWSCCCAASRCRPISILGKQQAKVIRRCRPNQPYAETLRGAGEPAHAKRRSNSDCDVAAASVCAMANWQRHGRAACKREWCGCVSTVA